MLKLLYVKRKSEQTIHSLPISPPLHPNCLAWPPRSAINSSWGCVFKFTDFFLKTLGLYSSKNITKINFI